MYKLLNQILYFKHFKNEGVIKSLDCYWETKKDTEKWPIWRQLVIVSKSGFSGVVWGVDWRLGSRDVIFKPLFWVSSI